MQVKSFNTELMNLKAIEAKYKEENEKIHVNIT